MQHIQRIDTANASPKAAELLSAVRKQMGGVPNILATMAQSPAALGGYLGFAGALAAGKLAPSLREQIALAVAGANRCDYCASVHTALGGKQGLSRDELSRNLRGRSAEPKTDAALQFVSRIVSARGHIAAADLAAVRDAGFDDEAIVEIVAHTALNIFTNYFNHVAGTEIDFPVVETARAHAA
ncbi:MAG: carboxymuconolactone decarboxylase family protein [Alphaproteobacteria bacterium]|nr:MAG: carboxymuconolactone decarboxylase family protein [Alphaproteobacteria bacterium]